MSDTYALYNNLSLDTNLNLDLHLPEATCYNMLRAIHFRFEQNNCHLKNNRLPKLISISHMLNRKQLESPACDK